MAFYMSAIVHSQDTAHRRGSIHVEVPKGTVLIHLPAGPHGQVCRTPFMELWQRGPALDALLGHLCCGALRETL